ncbi:hypothetical protein HID58_059361, partial [Brassica napus]
MGQQNLIYSFVARGTVILAEYTEFKGNFTSVAAQCLQKLPSSNNKFTYNCDGHTFNYLVENGFSESLSSLDPYYTTLVGFGESSTRLIGYLSFCPVAYCVVAVESAGRQITMAFLERVKEDFNKRYGGGKATTAKPNSLNKEFGSKLKGHMQYCVDHPEEINKLSKVKAQVTEVKGVMMENIEKVLDRGEKIELLVDKTENLRSQVSTRLQNTRNENKKKDVVGEHEDQAHSPRYHHCLDSDHYSLGLSWVQVYLNLETIRRLYYERLSAPYCSTRLMETPHR